MVAIVVGVVMGVWAYAEFTARLTSLRQVSELFQSDLLKKSLSKKPTGSRTIFDYGVTHI